MVSETDREASERVRESPDCVKVEGLLEQSWCEIWCSLGAKQEARRQHIWGKGLCVPVGRNFIAVGGYLDRCMAFGHAA